MKQLRLTITVLAAGLILCQGCSKKSAPSPEAAAPDETAQAAAAKTAKAAAPVDNAMVEAALKELEQKLQAQNYDAAVGSLLTLKDFPKSSKEQEQYQRQLQNTVDALAKRASQGDPSAKASQEMLGRFMTGR
jgi:hypothetical protein